VTILVRAEVRVRPGKHEEFASVARALAREAATEPGTLGYTWYRSADPNLFVVLEEYADPSAALAHNERCAPLLGRVAALADIESAALHGELGPELEGWVAGHDFAAAYPPLG
jgi:quinol monooxygenase YgiN